MDFLIWKSKLRRKVMIQVKMWEYAVLVLPIEVARSPRRSCKIIV